MSNPEFLKEGSAVEDFMHPDRVVVGADERLARASPTASPRSTSRSTAPIVRTDVASAEMIKLASNAFLATKISFINEIANVSEELGADVQRGRARHGPRRPDRPEVPAARASASAGQLLPEGRERAQAAGRQLGLPLPAAHRGDRGQRAPEAARRSASCRSTSGSLVGKEIALLGVAFKPDTDDIREATSLVLAARLQGEGANVRVYDPVAARERRASMLGGARVCDSALEALDGADAAVLVTEWPEFAELDWAGEVKQRMAQPLVVDGRNFLDREALRDGRLHLRGHRALSDAGARPRGRRGHAAAAAHPTTPKPVMPLAGRPFLTFMLDWLARHGVTEAILSCGFLSDGVRERARRHLRRHAAALRGRGGAARHRRAGAPGARRGPARGAAARAQRRRAHRHGPDRPARLAREHAARGARWR